MINRDYGLMEAGRTFDLGDLSSSYFSAVSLDDSVILAAFWGASLMWGGHIYFKHIAPRRNRSNLKDDDQQGGN